MVLSTHRESESAKKSCFEDFLYSERTFPTDIFFVKIFLCPAKPSPLFYVKFVFLRDIRFLRENLFNCAVLRTTLQCCLTTYDTGAFVCHTNDRTFVHRSNSAGSAAPCVVLLEHLGVSMTHLVYSIQLEGRRKQFSAELTF